MEAFKKTYTLVQTPLIGKERAALKDNPKIFNAALRVPGDERKSMATVSDMISFSGWFRSYVSSSEALGGSEDLLEGVEVPAAVPFETLEAALDGLYQARGSLFPFPSSPPSSTDLPPPPSFTSPTDMQGSIEINNNNLIELLQLSDAMLMDELREQCVRAALDGIPVATNPYWLAPISDLGSALGIPKLTEHAIGRMAYRSLSGSRTWLAQFAECLHRHVEGPAARRLAAVHSGLAKCSHEGTGGILRWPTSVVVALLMRVDQLADGAQPSAEECQQRKWPRQASPAAVAGLDVAALLREVDFDDIQLAEHRALSVMATNCTDETPALSLLMRRLLQRESGELPARDAGEAYPAGAPGTWVAGTLDFSASHWANPGPTPFRLPLLDLVEGSNKLFGSEEGAGHAARLSIKYQRAL